MTNKKKNNVVDIFKKRNDTLPVTDKSVLTNTTNKTSLDYECIGNNIYEAEEMSNSSQNRNLEENNDIKIAIKILNSKIENTNKIIGIAGTVIGLLVTVLIFAIDAKYDAIKEINNSSMNEIKTEIKAINQRLDYQEKLNSLQIERDVNKEIAKTKNIQ